MRIVYGRIAMKSLARLVGESLSICELSGRKRREKFAPFFGVNFIAFPLE